jgi:hypothetical protein
MVLPESLAQADSSQHGLLINLLELRRQRIAALHETIRRVSIVELEGSNPFEPCPYACS